MKMRYLTTIFACAILLFISMSLEAQQVNTLTYALEYRMVKEMIPNYGNTGKTVVISGFVRIYGDYTFKFHIESQRYWTKEEAIAQFGENFRDTTPLGIFEDGYLDPLSSVLFKGYNHDSLTGIIDGKGDNIKDENNPKVQGAMLLIGFAEEFDDAIVPTKEEAINKAKLYKKAGYIQCYNNFRAWAKERLGATDEDLKEPPTLRDKFEEAFKDFFGSNVDIQTNQAVDANLNQVNDATTSNAFRNSRQQAVEAGSGGEAPPSSADVFGHGGNPNIGAGGHGSGIPGDNSGGPWGMGGGGNTGGSGRPSVGGGGHGGGNQGNGTTGGIGGREDDGSGNVGWHGHSSGGGNGSWGTTENSGELSEASSGSIGATDGSIPGVGGGGQGSNTGGNNGGGGYENADNPYAEALTNADNPAYNDNTQGGTYDTFNPVGTEVANEGEKGGLTYTTEDKKTDGCVGCGTSRPADADDDGGPKGPAGNTSYSADQDVGPKGPIGSVSRDADQDSGPKGPIGNFARPADVDGPQGGNTMRGTGAKFKISR